MQLARNSGNLIGPHLMEEAIQENIQKHCQTMKFAQHQQKSIKSSVVYTTFYHSDSAHQGSGTAWPAITRDTVYAHLDANFPESRQVEYQAVSAGVLSHWPREGCILKQLGTPESIN